MPTDIQSMKNKERKGEGRRRGDHRGLERVRWRAEKRKNKADENEERGGGMEETSGELVLSVPRGHD